MAEFNSDIEGAWLCAERENTPPGVLPRVRHYCPAEGCPKRLVCARNAGWEAGQPTPAEYR